MWNKNTAAEFAIGSQAVDLNLQCMLHRQAMQHQAAQAFLQGYKQYPKSRRAADSLLKLGISLDRLGQRQQACAAYESVSSEYPKAVEARKRAQAEAKRAACAS